jgi:hypothetical protein
MSNVLGVYLFQAYLQSFIWGSRLQYPNGSLQYPSQNQLYVIFIFVALTPSNLGYLIRIHVGLLNLLLKYLNACLNLCDMNLINMHFTISLSPDRILFC